MAMNIEKYRVLLILLNAGSLDRYTFCVIDIHKDVDKNKILRAVIPKGLLKESILLEDAKQRTRRLFTNLTKPDYVISTQHKFLNDSYQVDLYANKNEHQLAKHYLDNFEKLKNKSSTLQQVANGEGIYLTEGDSQKSSWKLDHLSLRMSTFAFMFSIDLVLKNQTSALLKALREE